MDRELQREILLTLKNVYPNHLLVDSLSAEVGKDVHKRELFYLHGHGLIAAEVFEAVGNGWQIEGPRITHIGLDFLEADGGVSAILNTLTIRLHEDTIRDLLIERVEQSQESQSVKSRLVEAIRKAPADVISQLTSRAAQEGIERLPDVLPQLRALLGF